jgi:hypothetical protein
VVGLNHGRDVRQQPWFAVMGFQVEREDHVVKFDFERLVAFIPVDPAVQVDDFLLVLVEVEVVVEALPGSLDNMFIKEGSGDQFQASH